MKCVCSLRTCHSIDGPCLISDCRTVLRVSLGDVSVGEERLGSNGHSIA